MVDAWPGVLARNLYNAASADLAYYLGRLACTCDVGSRGHEWYSGCGVPPDAIAGREWNHDPHPFTPGAVAAPPRRHRDHAAVLCTACGEDQDWYLHHQCPGCFVDCRQHPQPHHCEFVDGCACDLCVQHRDFLNRARQNDGDEFAEPASSDG